MRFLNRNTSTIYYATYTRNAEAVDGAGKYTGERTMTYSNPIVWYANVSKAHGQAYKEFFGILVDYDKTIVTDTSCTATETSVFWIDTMPTLVAGATTTPHDYVVKAVAPSLNSVTYAVKKVKVNAS